MDRPHRPVLLGEVVEALAPRDGGSYVDGTLGGGGHAEAILAASGPGGRLLGLDRDPAALALAGARLAPFGGRVALGQGTFDQLGRLMAEKGFGPADGILLDLGVSSMQLDQPERGFAFRHDAPLDMRMGVEGQDAASLLAGSDEDGLARLFRDLGEEPLARRFARALVQARRQEPIATTGRLAEVLWAACPAAERRKRKTHPATQVFQALRIAVNDELGQLERFLSQAPALLAVGGVLAVISYHSLEDRRVKRAMRAWAEPCTCPPGLPVCACGRLPLFRLGRGGAVKPTAAEVADNPRSRSARLRWAARTEAPA